MPPVDNIRFVRPRRRRGLGFILPANVPARLKPWTGQDSAPYPAPQGPGANTADPMRARAGMYESMFKSFGGRSAANATAPAYDQSIPPWVNPPAGFEPFLWQAVLGTPAANGTDVTVTTLFNAPVPQGWDGVIQTVACFYTGPGFVAGAGVLSWRITRNGQAIKTFDNIQIALGTYTQQGGVQPLTLPSPIRIFAGEVIKFIVNHQNIAGGLSTNGTNIIVSLGGYTYPKQ